MWLEDCQSAQTISLKDNHLDLAFCFYKYILLPVLEWSSEFYWRCANTLHTKLVANSCMNSHYFSCGCYLKIKLGLAREDLRCTRKVVYQRKKFMFVLYRTISVQHVLLNQRARLVCWLVIALHLRNHCAAVSRGCVFFEKGNFINLK
jgi:hypothetical protein